MDLSDTRWNGVYGLPKFAGFISGLENFDAEFFGFTDTYANSMDPQSRMILEHAYEAILDAGMYVIIAFIYFLILSYKSRHTSAVHK